MSTTTATGDRALRPALSRCAYQTNVANVADLVTSVLSSALPILHEDPPNWVHCVAAHKGAQEDALDWVNRVMTRLLSVPGDVRDHDDVMSGLLDSARQHASALNAHPSDAAAKAGLDHELAGLSAQLPQVANFVSQTSACVDEFRRTMPDMALQLQTVSDDATDAVGAERPDGDDPASRQLAERSARIVRLAAAEDLPLTFGVVPVAGMARATAVAAGPSAISLDGIAAPEAAPLAEGADTAALQAVARHFHALARRADNLDATLDAVRAAWTSLEDEVCRAVDDVRAAVDDAAYAAYDTAHRELVDAKTAWQAAYEHAGGLHVTLQFSGAQLAIGMSSDEVAQALAQAATMSVSDYCNRSAA